TRFRAHYIDDLAPVQRAIRDMTAEHPAAQRKELNERAERAFRLMHGYVGEADHMLEHGTLKFGTRERVGRPLKEILAPVQKHLDDFRAYLLSRRDIELQTREGAPIETGGRLEDARWTVQHMEQKHAAFAEAARQLYQYQDELLQYLVDAGVVGADAAGAMRELNRNYVPFFRVLEDAEAGRRSGLAKQLDHLFAPQKRIKGSGRDIVDPLESIVQNTFAFAKLAARQRASQVLGQLAQGSGRGQWLEQVDAPQRVTTANVAELEKQLREVLGDEAFDAWLEQADQDFKQETDGLDADEIRQRKISKATLAEELVRIFRPGDLLGTPNVISVLEGGERTWYKVNDPDLYAALIGAGREQLDVVTRLFSWPAKILRAGATLAPEFMARNPARDQVLAFIQSEHGFVPGVDLVRGIFHILGQSELYWQWKASGGDRASLIGLDREYLQERLRELAGQKRGRIENVIKTPIELVQALSALMEEGTRLGEYARARKKLGDGTEARERAAEAAREISTDYARHGLKLAGVRAISAFWNARIQGYDRLFRAFKRDPFGAGARTFLAITLPEILLHLANRDDPEYWEIPQWQRDLFWVFKVGNTWVRVPRPFELGVIAGALPARALEWAENQDPEAFKKAASDFFTREFVDTVLPIPTFAGPLIGNLANYDLFLNRPIVPRHLENVDAEYQYSDRTSEVAKQLGRWLDYSPAKIDNLLTSWTGGLGRLGGEAIDNATRIARRARGEEVPARPSRGVAGLPGVRGFTLSTPGSSSESVERFYQLYGEAEKAHGTVRVLEKEGAFDELDRYEGREDVQKRLDEYPFLAKDAEYLSSIRKEMAEVRKDPKMGGREKQRLLDELGKTMQQNAAAAIQRRTRPVPTP
ncbi:MAG TPA: LPD38 domain-containing protein, partial [Longimicrobiaceae bacterium]|nr:LPD38 domain-containing protein [Longimicrobiaceae bacterium]